MAKGLNEIIKQKRIERGLSLREVERILGISRSTLSRIESNSNLNARNKNVARLVDFYSINFNKNHNEREYIDISDFSPVNKKLVYLIKEKEEAYKSNRKANKTNKK